MFWSIDSCQKGHQLTSVIWLYHRLNCTTYWVDLFFDWSHAQFHNEGHMTSSLLIFVFGRKQIGLTYISFWKLSNFGENCRFKWIFIMSSGACILGDPGADSGDEEKSKRAEKYGTKKSKERREEPLGTMSYQTSSKRLPPFWLLIGARKLVVRFVA